MAQEVTLGGDRIGSGNKQKVELHNYEMSTFNLEQDFKSSMAPGILYPFIKMVGLNHDTFDIDLDSFVRTLPTKGPLFGSYKLQLDVYEVPMRLYQGILHNNPVGIGLKMNQVYLPKIKYTTIDGKTAPRVEGTDEYNRQVSESALLKYLGFSGAGHRADYGSVNGTVMRKINAVPALAYYDIFKCYYSNKQEENAYVLTPGSLVEGTATINLIRSQILDGSTGAYTYTTCGEDEAINITLAELQSSTLTVMGENLDPKNIVIKFYSADLQSTWSETLKELQETNYARIASQSTSDTQYIQFTALCVNGLQIEFTSDIAKITISANNEQITTSEIAMTSFPLANIDEMRNRLLSSNTLGAEFVIDDTTNLLPYSALVNTTDDGTSWNAFANNGLVVKTYQSDLFNNWLDTEFIDGANGISALSAVAIVDNKFTMDSLNLAEKIYEVLNRVAVSGGTYEDWQEAVYGEGAVRKAETPMYMGGMAAEIMFEEVISSAETNVEGDFQPLGALGGKGTQVGKKGGNNIHIKCTEPCYIIGIASITPRICYTQGNDWDLTEIDTLDDLHKPALDGIGFQDLMVEQFAWWDTVMFPGDTAILHRNSAGKQIAWINYQTSVDKAFGDFAKTGGNAFMVLSRNYEMDDTQMSVKDVTTYIDPSKYNYAFAYTKLDAQNFWVQIHSNVKARRKMGAQQIPNL